VGWYTLVPTTGPLPELELFQRYITSLNEINVLLAIHPTAFERSDTADQKLPVTVYESTVESGAPKDDSSMQVDGEESSTLKYRPVPYTVETDEAEMIAINFVSKGAGSAAAVADIQPAATIASEPPAEDRKGKKRASPEVSQPKPQEPTDLEVLSTEEQDQIANLTTRLNSVKMLQSRLAQLQAFVSSLPPSYLSDQTIPISAESPNPVHLSHIRNIQALLTRLSLLSPPPTTGGTETGLEAASRAQRNDVTLTQLLSTLSKDVQGLQDLGKTFSIVDQARASKRKTAGGAFDATSMMGEFQGPGGRGMLV
jgi:COP9 signalosome complex subunit 6